MTSKYFIDTNIQLSEYQLNQFAKFRDLILEYNKVMDITNITEEDQMYIKHFLDSILLNKSEIDLDGKKIIDIGTGGGFPGIPLKIVYPNSSFTLMDSLNKRINFLHDVVDVMEFDGVEPIHARAEELARKEGYREEYDIATSRAVADLRTLAEYCMAFVKPGGYFIAMKGPNYKEELENSRNAIDTMGGKLEKVVSYDLPEGNGERNLIIIKKVRPTPKKYPRGQGKPKNKPL